MIHRPCSANRCLNRLSEWTLSIAMLMMGIHIVIFPDSLEVSRLEPILDITWAPILCVLYIATGAARIAGLYFNGRFGYCYVLRSLGAFIGSANWLQFSLALVLFAHEKSVDVSPAVWLLTCLSMSELISVYRAIRDGNSSAQFST